MSEARQLFMEVNLAAQKQSLDEIEALNTFRGPQGQKGDPGSIDNLTINGKKAAPVDGKNRIDLTAEDVGAAKEESVSRLSQQKVDKANVVNNFTTTEEGFVADARALKVLNDTFGIVQSTRYTTEYLDAAIEFYKVGKIVYMHCKGNATKEIAAWVIWGVMPEGYRVASADGCYFIEANSISAKMRTDRTGEMKMDKTIAAGTSVNFDIMYITM